MRIISSFKDYYDCGMQYGYDPKIIYDRVASKQIIKVENLYQGTDNSSYIKQYIGFAGKIYTIYKNWKEKTYSYEEPPKEEKKRWFSRNSFWDSKNNIDQLIKFFDLAPVFLVYHEYGSKWNLELNPILGTHLNFQHILDPYTAYQQLSMWYGNRYFPSDNIPEVSDKDLAQAKGFDKYSFRKEKWTN